MFEGIEFKEWEPGDLVFVEEDGYPFDGHIGTIIEWDGRFYSVMFAEQEFKVSGLALSSATNY